MLAAADSADLEGGRGFGAPGGAGGAGRGTVVRSQGDGTDDGAPAGTDDPCCSLGRDGVPATVPIVFADAEGRSTRYVPNDKKEKHQLTAGTIETKTKWDKGQLRQEISLPPGIKAVRVFIAVPETKQLTVTTSLEKAVLVGGGHPRGSSMTRTRGPDAARLESNTEEQI